MVKVIKGQEHECPVYMPWPQTIFSPFEQLLYKINILEIIYIYMYWQKILDVYTSKGKR